MPSVEITCPVFPSEDPDKVSQAIRNIFPAAELTVTDGRITGTASSLEHFGKLVRKQKILDTARSVFLRGARDDSTSFRLNKQVAFAGKITFAEERTLLGVIKVTVTDPELIALIDDLLPVTVDGEEVRI